MNPESRSDLDHGTLTTIQPPNHTHDPQTGDISAVLQENQNEERKQIQQSETHTSGLVGLLNTNLHVRVAYQDFTTIALSCGHGPLMAPRRRAGVP